MSQPTVIMTDEDLEGKLQNYCYTFCENNSTNDIKNSRGLVYRDGQPFLKSFGYTPQYTFDTIDEETLKFIKDNFKDFKFFESYEGTLLRLFFNDINNKWYLSTHRKLNAVKSRWGSGDTFGQQFNKIIPEDMYEKFDKNYNYMFIMTPNKNNRIVCTNTDSLYHIGTYDKNFNLSTDYDIGVQRPLQFEFEEFKDFEKHIEYQVDITKTQGMIIHHPQTQTNIKMYNKKYYDYFKVRNNVPSIMFRYLQVRTDEEMNKKMMELYPDHHNRFIEYENKLSDISSNLYYKYMDRFVKKIYTTVSPPENAILKMCHGWHLRDKAHNKISVANVMKVINSAAPELLNKLVKLK